MVLHPDKHPGPAQGTTPTHQERVRSQIVTVTTLCPDCRLVLFPGEACKHCSGDVERFMRWQYGMETRERN
jgi:hypothetical protein